MSEYQYYEFQAIDRPLSKQQMAELRAISSRAEITPTRFTNSYSYGDFRGDPIGLIEQYYDAHVYVANWGSHSLIFGMPSTAVDVKALQAYQAEGGFVVQERHERLIVTFESQDEEGGGWVDEGEGGAWMSALVGLRADLMNGDLRAAYLGWLRGLQAEGLDFDEDEDEDNDAADRGLRLVTNDDDEDEGPDTAQLEPPVPPGLGSLSGPLEELARFLEIDQHLLAVAAEASEPLTDTEPLAGALRRWIGELSSDEKSELLLRLMQGDTQVPSELRRRFRAATAPATAARTTPRRTVGELVTAAQARAAERKRQEAAAAEQERHRKSEETRRARDAHLRSLIGKEATLWHQAQLFIAKKLANDYDRAVTILADLRDLAAREGNTADFNTRLHALRNDHSNLPAFIRRLDQKRLV